MRRLMCAFVVPIWYKQVFSWRGSYMKMSAMNEMLFHWYIGECGGSVVECRTPEREVGGSKPTTAVLCPWARQFTPWHDWKIVDWDVKPQHKQNKHWYIRILLLQIIYFIQSDMLPWQVHENFFYEPLHEKTGFCHMRPIKARSSCASAQFDKGLCCSLPR